MAGLVAAFLAVAGVAVLAVHRLWTGSDGLSNSGPTSDTDPRES